MDQDIEIFRNMTQATLYGYQLCKFAESSPPVIVRSSDPNSFVEGMLIFDLDKDQRNSIYDLEEGLTKSTRVDVEICQQDFQHLRSLRTIESVGTFVWSCSRDGLAPLGTAAWNIDNFLDSPFYDNIMRSQYAVSTESRLSSIADLRTILDPYTPPEERASASMSRSRFRSSLESISEGME